MGWEPVKPIRWLKTRRCFGDIAIKLFSDGMIHANSKEEAVRQMCEHFVDEDGRPMKPESILQNLRNRREVEQKG